MGLADIIFTTVIHNTILGHEVINNTYKVININLDLIILEIEFNFVSQPEVSFILIFTLPKIRSLFTYEV